MCTRLEPTAPRSGISRNYSSIPHGQSACYKDPMNDDVAQLQYSKLLLFSSIELELEPTVYLFWQYPSHNEHR